jgi:hypothetical protein
VSPDGENKRIEQETAEIERAYIHNLQKQVYFLELELESTKKQQADERSEREHLGRKPMAEDASIVIEALKTKLSGIESR